MNFKPGIKIFFLINLATIGLVIVINSCRHDPLGVENLDTICFETQVLPIFQTSCGISGCHGGGSNEGGFSATSYSSIAKRVKAGDPKGSDLYTIISNPLNPNMMPPDKSLTKDQRTIIEVWILQGAKNTTCTTK